MSEKITYTAKILNGLTKVFLDEEPKTNSASLCFSTLQDEVFSFSVAYWHSDWLSPYARVRLESPIAQYCHLRSVENVPSSQPVRAFTDDNYLRTAPGMFPDLLRELNNNVVLFSATRKKSLWIDVLIPKGSVSGDFNIDIIFETDEGEELCRAGTSLKVYNIALAPQTMLHTEWFHADCLADYYKVEVFGERHWQLIDNFVRTAAKRGCNMILTPQFTPPLDTAFGGERTTVQLVKIKQEGDSYTFDFSLMKKWVDLCLAAGITHFEMSHLFTQWGATAAPKIMGEKNGEYIQLFGWDTNPTEGAYPEFLSQYLPSLTAKLKEWGIHQVTRFHISDEPHSDQLQSYLKAKQIAAPYLEGFCIMDALSDYEIYKNAQLGCPVCANNAMEGFCENKVSPLWSYYCTAQFLDVSNRFMSMPLARCRIFGIQAFKFNLEGILHWGYNFYNAKHSIYHINPYFCTDAGGVFPSGDAFLVYPGDDGKPEESLRLMAMCHAMQDVRALQMLAKAKGNAYAISLLEENLSSPITFKNYPKSDEYLINIRNRINRELAEISR